MMLLPLVLSLSLAANPDSCKGERVVLVPFQPVALSSTRTRQLEDTVRRALEPMSGLCLEPRVSTVARMRAQGGRLPDCVDAGCRGAQVTALGADRLVRGMALGVGGQYSVLLTLVDRQGQELRTSLQLSGEQLPPGEEELMTRQVLANLWPGPPFKPQVVERRGKAWPTVLLAAGGVALAAGVGFGLAARRTETGLSTGTEGCTGDGEAFRSCFAGRLQQGRQQSRAANVLMGAGAVLGAGGGLLLVWELP